MLSCITQEVAKEFAKNEAVHVSCLVSEINKDSQDKAKEHDVDLFCVRSVRGQTPLECLSFPPESVPEADAIIGFGKIIGRQAKPLRWSPKYAKSKLVHFFCSSSHEDGNEIDLCEDSDLMFAIGTNVAKESKARLRSFGTEVHPFTPGVFNELRKYRQADEGDIFRMIIFYPSATELAENEEDYSIPTKALRLLPDMNYRLISVCNFSEDADEVKRILVDQYGISKEQLNVRSHSKSLEYRCRLFVEADLLILPFLPSNFEDFGFIALQAISADLPVLVSKNTGLGKALWEVPHGSSCVVDSENPKDWRDRIMAVKKKDRALRLLEARQMRENFDKKYSWEKQCKTALEEILTLL